MTKPRASADAILGHLGLTEDGIYGWIIHGWIASKVMARTTGWAAVEQSEAVEKAQIECTCKRVVEVNAR